MIGENGVFTDEFSQKLPEMLGDAYYNDPETKQQPTKVFENVKDMPTLLKNYANAQRTISKGEAAFAEKTKGMVKLPTDKSTPEEIAAYHKAVGVPESADKYELKIPEVDEGEKAGFVTIASAVKAAAHEAGVPAGALGKVWEKVTTALSQQNKDLEAKGLALMKADEDALKAKYAGKYDSFMKAGDDALGKFKNGAEAKKILDNYGITNHPAVRELLAELAPLVLEDKTNLGGGSAPESSKGIFSYQYDSSGKPVS